jgi:hypothetical protein
MAEAMCRECAETMSGSEEARHFLRVLDEINRLNLEFVRSVSRSVQASSGAAPVVIIGTIAEP